MDHNEMTYTAAQHEREMTREETHTKRWFTVSMFLLCLLLISYAGMAAYVLLR